MVWAFTFFLVQAITDGENAVDILGQSTNNDGVTPDYIGAGANDGANLYGLSGPTYSEIDATHNRLFISDTSNNRVLVFNLNGSNQLAERTPDYVLGQADFVSGNPYTTQGGLNQPKGLAYDSTNDKLYVADTTNNRVLAYDVASITNGENAVSVLGQANYISSGSATTQAGMFGPTGLVYDSVNTRLFVSEIGNNRVTTFDVATIVNGENAVNVLGEANFTSSTGAKTQAGMSQPRGMAYNSTNQNLYVADGGWNRVMIYDVASISNGENAINVLGEPNFTTASNSATQAGMGLPSGVAYDSANNRLFVSQIGSINRITVYDIAAITNGENAVNVIGQVNFTTGTAANTQAGVNGPEGIVYDSTNNRLFVPQSGNHRATVYNAAIGTLIPNNAGTNGPNAIDVIGQSTNDDGVTADYTGFTPNEGQDNDGFYGPGYMEIDSVHHRLFVSDNSQYRVLVFNLNSSNQLTDKTPDYVLGQADFKTANPATTQSSFVSPAGLAYDSTGDRLFVVDGGSHRVLIYDTATIINGENAVNVLGQSNYTNSSSANTQAGMNSPQSVAYDNSNKRLFVVQSGNNRVTTYDVNPNTIANGENASKVLGQANFTATAAANTQAGMNLPFDVEYDSVNQRLFVAQSSSNRVTTYDVNPNTIANGENASNVLGQANFTATSGATTQAGMNTPRSLAYDTASQRLFVGQIINNRVTIYDVNSISNGENAINVLGQANFTSSGSANTQSGLSFTSGLVYDSTNNLLYVSENTGNRIKIFNANDRPVLGTISDTPDPVSVGSNITFSSGAWTDANTADTQKLFVCKTNVLTSAYTGGCAGGAWYAGSSYTAANPQTGTYTALVADIATSPNSYYVFICDSSQQNNSCSVSSSGTFTVQNNITASSTGSQTASLTIPSTDQYIGGAFAFVRDSTSANITQIVLSEKGTVNANTNLSNVKLFYKQEVTCSASIPAGTTAFNAVGVGFNASDQATVTGSIAVGTSQICVYVTMDVGIGATDGDTFEIEITNPSTDVTVSAGTVSPGTAVAISGSTTLNGTLTVDIVDGSSNSVGSPSVTFSALGFGFASQTSTGTLGIASEKIRVLNTRGTLTWTLSIAATSGGTALWSGGTPKYDYNDSSGATDGGDADSYGGQLTLNPSAGTLAAVAPCASTTGLSKGSSSAYSEGVVSSVSLLTAGGSASTNCQWDFTGTSLSQSIPGSQAAGTYNISFTITIV